MAVDILHDIEIVLIDAGVQREVVRQSLAVVRQRWGGGSAYIPKRDSAAIDDQIQNGIAAGVPPDDLARKIGIHASTIRRRRSRWL